MLTSLISAALRLGHDYLSKRKQRIKTENTYSTCAEIIFELSQSSMLGPLLFNIFLADLFFIVNDIDIENYADDNTPYVIADNIDDLIKSLEEASTVSFQWFDNNLLKNNPDKYHLLINRNDNVPVHVGKCETENSKCEKLLDVKLKWKQNIDDHISNVCKKATGKLNTLARIASFIRLSKSLKLINAFFNSQFSYCPLI